MKELLRDVCLRTGESMRIWRVTPPAGEYEEALVHFLEHKGDRTLRGIRQRLAGHYADLCDDRFFVGEIEGRIAGQLWYGFPREGSGIANFGEVYTEPVHRRKGITSTLMEDFASDFATSDATGAFCNCGRLHVARIYMKHGFRYALPDNALGALALIKDGCGDPEGFAAFEADYYRGGEGMDVTVGTMAHRHDVDKLMRLAFQMRGGCPERLGPGAAVGSFAEALYLSEDGRGTVTVGVTGDRHVVGWGFFLRMGSASERCASVCDWEVRPNYEGKMPELISGGLGVAREAGVERAFAYSSSVDGERIRLLESAGFRECARLPEACMSAGDPVDEVVHVWSEI